MNLGYYPGVIFPDSEPTTETFVAERVEVSTATLAELDRYEGYYEEAPEASLYIRRPLLDGWVYEYNHEAPPEATIPGGDWLAFTGEAGGRASNMLLVEG